MVAGEPSGDLLAATVVEALHERAPEVALAGIGGPRMQAQGFDAWYPMQKLAVNGYADVLMHLPELLSIRRTLRERWLAERPAAFVGVDAPDFNFGLEHALREGASPPCTSSVPRYGPGAVSASTRSARPFPTCWSCSRSRSRSTATPAFP